MTKPLMRRFRTRVGRPLVQLIVLSIVSANVPAFASERMPADVPSASQTAAATASLSKTDSAPLLQPGPIERSIAVEARRFALASAAQGSGNSTNSKDPQHNCGWGAFFLAGGALAATVSLVEVHNWQNSIPPPPTGSRIPGSDAFGIAGGAIMALLGTMMMVTHCGQ